MIRQFYKELIIMMLLSGLLLWTVCMPTAPTVPPVIPPPVECPRWEYKIQYSLPTPRPERKGEDAAKATSITPTAEELTALGKEGWELVGLVMENETAYPQFDKVAVPNVRPQRLVLFFKSCKR